MYSMVAAGWLRGQMSNMQKQAGKRFNALADPARPHAH
jgi:hypothetical protein